MLSVSPCKNDGLKVGADRISMRRLRLYVSEATPANTQGRTETDPPRENDFWYGLTPMTWMVVTRRFSIHRRDWAH